MSKVASYKGLGASFQDVETLSTASSAVNLTLDQQGKLLVMPQHASSGQRMFLPAPEAGLQYHIYFLENAVSGTGSVGSKIVASSEGTYDIFVAGSSAEVVVPCNGSSAQAGVGLSLYAINDYRWVVSRFGGSTLIPGTTTT